MARSTRLSIRWCMVAIAILGYFFAFPELAALLGIALASLLFVSPVVVLSYLACRVSLGGRRPASTRQ